MRVALTGSHRSGKTTLARAVGKKLGIHCQETSTSALLKAHGINPVAPMSFEERLAMQEILLRAHEEMLATAPRALIVDRTPLDMLAYTYAEIGMHDAHSDLQERLAQYRQKALSLTSENYPLLIVINPLPSYEEQPDKPPHNTAYQWHVQSIIQGLTLDLRDGVMTAIMRSTDLDSRITGCCELITDLNKMHASHRAEYAAALH